MSERMRMYNVWEDDTWEECRDKDCGADDHRTAILLDAEDEKAIDKIADEEDTEIAFATLLRILRPEKP